ncbi:MAG: hypothetical protein IJ527_09780 [Prevotella sp.]|nr:hypothetical protein [Prevotella sp.]
MQTALKLLTLLLRTLLLRTLQRLTPQLLSNSVTYEQIERKKPSGIAPDGFSFCPFPSQSSVRRWSVAGVADFPCQSGLSVLFPGAERAVPRYSEHDSQAFASSQKIFRLEAKDLSARAKSFDKHGFVPRNGAFRSAEMRVMNLENDGRQSAKPLFRMVEKAEELLLVYIIYHKL